MPPAAPSSLDLLGINSTLPPKPVTSSAEEHVKNLSVTMVLVSNTRDFTHPVFRRIAPTVSSRHEAGNETLRTTTPEELVSGWEAVLHHFPDYRTNIIDVQTSVNHVSGTAKVWLLRTAEGFPDGLRRDVVSELTWTRKDDEWLIVKYRGLRFFPWYQSETFYGGESTNASERKGSVDSGSDQSVRGNISLRSAEDLMADMTG